MSRPQNEMGDKLRNARLVAITSVIIALAVNIIGVYAVNYPEITVIVIVVIFIITVFVLIYFSGFETTKYSEIHTCVLYDGTTGEITDYPDNVVQTLLRQTLNKITLQEPTIKARLSSFGIGSEEIAIFIEMAEVVILSQISNLLSSMPPDYLADFLPLSSPPEYLKNSIIRTIKDTILKDKSAATSMINSFESYWLPKNGSFTISHDVFNRPSQARLITLQKKYIRINITYQVTQNVYLSSVKHWLMHGAPFTEISDIAINPRYQADALKRLTEHQLR
ncbi:MAG: hypothetical protein WA667_09810, partial [Candidatus Nitrosopolaris sp.]